MNLFENISIALEGLRLNKMRTFLTMLGIIIGIASVIAIITIGDAMTNSVSDGFNAFSNTLMGVGVMPKDGFNWQNLSSKDRLPKSCIEDIKNGFENRIEEIIIDGKGTTGKIINHRDEVQVNIQSTSPGYKTAFDINVQTGRFLNTDDILSNKEVIVISDKVVNEVFKNLEANDILGNEIQISTMRGEKFYTVVGIYKYKQLGGIIGGFQGSDITSAFIPYTVGNSQYGEDNDPDSLENVNILAKDRNDMDKLGKEISELLQQKYFADNEVAKIDYRTLASELEQVNKVMGTISLAIGGIAAISLLVGGIGVMNILLVSVTERTREIGIRKALGATKSDIQGQFITESVIICIIGGAIGVFLGGLGGYAASSIMDSPTLPSLLSIIIAVGFSMAIGIFFGFYPANKAAKLDPIEALRYE